MLSLCSCSSSSLVGGEQGGYSLDAEHRFFIAVTSLVAGFPCGLAGKESACSSGDLDSISALGRSPGEGNGNSLQYSCTENPIDRGAWWAIVHEVAKSQT